MTSIIISSLASGILGAMGLGGGSVLLLYLTLVQGMGQLTAQGINLIFFIPCAVLALIIHTKNKLVNWKAAIRISLWGFIGVFSGWYLAGILETDTMAKILGAVLLIMGIKELFSKGKDKETE